MIEVIEQSVTGKRNREECEDGIVATADFVAVIDGSTSKSQRQLSAEMRNGKLCMTIVADFISEKLSSDATAEEFCCMVTDEICQCYDRLGADKDELRAKPTARMAASAIVYSRRRKELWMVGDCQALVCKTGIVYENPKPYEAPIADMRSARIRLGLLEGDTIEDYKVEDKGRKFILPFLTESCRNQNITYPVIDGFDIPFNTVKVISLNGYSGEIVLASDGYPFLKSTLAESELALQHLLSEDPLCVNLFKATKGLMAGNCSFDDRAYIRFRV